MARSILASVISASSFMSASAMNSSKLLKGSDAAPATKNAK
jgi:hypothetical protein